MSDLNEGVQLKRPSFWIKVWPAFDPLRSGPRYHDLVRRIGIPEE